MLIPNVDALERSLTYFANIIEADEVLLFERATFLVISHCQRKQHKDLHRFEKVSNIIKQFKLSCSKLGAKFQSMEVRNSQFAAFINTFTSNTYIMVIMSDPTIPSEAALINIRNARKYFEELENPNATPSSSHMLNWTKRWYFFFYSEDEWNCQLIFGFRCSFQSSKTFSFLFDFNTIFLFLL